MHIYVCHVYLCLHWVFNSFFVWVLLVVLVVDWYEETPTYSFNIMSIHANYIEFDISYIMLLYYTCLSKYIGAYISHRRLFAVKIH